MPYLSDLDVCVQLLRPTGTLPERATAGASGYDLRMAGWRWPWSQEVQHGHLILDAGERALALTGFAMSLSEGWEAQIRGRSGLALKHGLQVAFVPRVRLLEVAELTSTTNRGAGGFGSTGQS